MSDYRLLYVTVADPASGRRLAKRLVEENLAACAHLFPAGSSFYRWEGNLMEESEMVVVAKTTADRATEAIDRIAEWHDYEIPCVLSLPIEAGHQPFLRWIDESLRS